MESVTELRRILKQPHSSSSKALSSCVRDSLVHSNCPSVTKKNPSWLTRCFSVSQSLTKEKCKQEPHREHMKMSLIKIILKQVWQIFALKYTEFFISIDHATEMNICKYWDTNSWKWIWWVLLNICQPNSTSQGSICIVQVFVQDCPEY